MSTDVRTLLLQRFDDATARIEALIEATPTPTDASREAVQARAVVRMSRLSRFLERLGNPQQHYPIVHVGGTSGKGSTSTAIASILTAAGFRTGLHTSPYLQTPAEKLQVDGALISPEAYIALCDELLTEHDRWVADGGEYLTYGEAWVALTLWFFQRSGVDAAVLEVGAGGRFDLTNIVQPTVSVVTSVGIDHTNTLGSTIADIAWHKAGIIKTGVPAVTGVSNQEALEIITSEASTVGAPLTVVSPEIAVTDVETNQHGTSWTNAATGQRYHSSLRGGFQARNGALAIATVEALRDSGWNISNEAIAEGLQRARIPGRIELIADNCPVMLDGAHNAEKVAALAEDVPQLLPVGEHGRRIGILGVLESKQATEMLGSIVPVIDVLVATSPQVVAKEGRAASAMADIARDAGFHGEVHIEPDPAAAIELALSLSDASRGDAVLVTGSLYLVGNIRERWYATHEIVLAQSSWPKPSL